MAKPRSDDGPELTRGALEALYAKMEKPIFNVIYRRLWDAGEAQEIAQDAFLRLWAARRKVRPETVEPLLYRTALNLAAKRRRSRRLWRWVSLDAAASLRAASPAADEALAQGEREARLRRVIDAMPEKLRSVLLLTELSGLGHAEVAAALRIPVGTVASRRHLAMKRLQIDLGGAT
ncbi:MAG: RNA polymerase sigma factor [Myxococcales bacterium]